MATGSATPEDRLAKFACRDSVQELTVSTTLAEVFVAWPDVAHSGQTGAGD